MTLFKVPYSLKCWVAPAEMAELAAWRDRTVQYYATLRAHHDTALVLRNLEADVKGKDVRTLWELKEFLDETQSKRQVDFLAD
jgi:hypothetical protein